MSKLRVLVSGASVAGPALAYWLVRAGCQVTVVERASSLRTAGQGLDVRDTARDVVKRMGIFDRLRAASSHEEGLKIVDNNDRCFASFGADTTSGKGESITSDIEILRGELAKILVDITKNDVSYIFGDMVESLKETNKEVEVTFTNSKANMAFDLVVAADGLGSKIRNMAFGNDPSHVKSCDAYVAYFSIPRSDTDSLWARAHWLKKGRNVVVRPDNLGQTRAFLMLAAYKKSDKRLTQLERVSKGSILEQKALIHELFQDSEWETPRILKGMHESDDFYLQHVAQVRLNRWSNGRTAVIGDAGYAPSPFAGMGTSIAFIGAYVLAGEISRQPNNVPAALESYERILRPYVESIQKLPPGIPWIILPQSALGTRVFETVMWSLGILTKSWLATPFLKIAALFQTKADIFRLPEYEAFKE